MNQFIGHPVIAAPRGNDNRLAQMLIRCLKATPEDFAEVEESIKYLTAI